MNIILEKQEESQNDRAPIVWLWGIVLKNISFFCWKTMEIIYMGAINGSFQDICLMNQFKILIQFLHKI